MTISSLISPPLLCFSPLGAPTVMSHSERTWCRAAQHNILIMLSGLSHSHFHRLILAMYGASLFDQLLTPEMITSDPKFNYPQIMLTNSTSHKRCSRLKMFTFEYAAQCSMSVFTLFVYVCKNDEPSQWRRVTFRPCGHWQNLKLGGTSMPFSFPPLLFPLFLSPFTPPYLLTSLFPGSLVPSQKF